MNYKVLFLDIDGVLNNYKWVEAYHDRTKTPHAFGNLGELFQGNITPDTVNFDPENVANLKDIIDHTQCHIVLSSSWRIAHGLFITNLALQSYGLPPAIDQTPSRGCKRGGEIEEWMQEHGFIERYVIVDDDGDFFDLQPLVQINPEVGLTTADADAIITILNEE